MARLLPTATFALATLLAPATALADERPPPLVIPSALPPLPFFLPPAAPAAKPTPPRPTTRTPKPPTTAPRCTCPPAKPAPATLPALPALLGSMLPQLQLPSTPRAPAPRPPGPRPTESRTQLPGALPIPLPVLTPKASLPKRGG